MVDIISGGDYRFSNQYPRQILRWAARTEDRAKLCGGGKVKLRLRNVPQQQQRDQTTLPIRWKKIDSGARLSTTPATMESNPGCSSCNRSDGGNLFPPAVKAGNAGITGPNHSPLLHWMKRLSKSTSIGGRKPAASRCQHGGTGARLEVRRYRYSNCLPTVPRTVEQRQAAKIVGTE